MEFLTMTVGHADCAVITVLDILLSANSSHLSSTEVHLVWDVTKPDNPNSVKISQSFMGAHTEYIQ